IYMSFTTRSVILRKLKAHQAGEPIARGQFSLLLRYDPRCIKRMVREKSLFLRVVRYHIKIIAVLFGCFKMFFRLSLRFLPIRFQLHNTGGAVEVIGIDKQRFSLLITFLQMRSM